MFQRNGNWITDFVFEGVRYKKALGKGISKTVAKEREGKYKQEVREGKHNIKARKIRFEKFVEKYLDHARINKKPKSATRNEVSIGQLMPYFKGKLLGSIVPFHVEQYKKARRDGGASPATVNRDVACLRNMMNMAVEWKYLQVNPIARVKMLSEDNEVMWVLSSEEESRLLEECHKRPQKGVKYLRDLVEFALYSGMRQGEIFGLRWVHVHVDDNFLLATDTKTLSNRAVPVNETLKEILQRRRDLGKEYVFTNSADGRLTVLTNAFWKAVKDAGLTRHEVKNGKTVKVRFRFHDLRHSFGSRLGMNGVDLKTIMEIMGHKTAKTAMRYQHPSPSHKMKAVNELDKIRKIYTPKVTPKKVVNLNNIVISTA